MTRSRRPRGWLWIAILAGAALVGCDAAGPDSASPVAVRDCRLHLELRPIGLPARVEWVGAPVNPGRHALTRDADGVFRGALALPPGRALYRLEVDGRPLLDPHNPLTVRHAGVEWSVAHIERCDAPRWRLTGRRFDRGGAPTLELRFERAAPDAALDPRTVEARADAHRLTPAVDGERVTLDLGALPPGRYTVTLTGRDTAGRDTAPHRGAVWVDPEPFRWEDAIVYQVVLDRFAGDAPFTPADRVGSPARRLGGTLRGLLDALESGYLDAFGVNTLWISPLYLNPEGAWAGVEGGPPRYESYHGYWPVDSRAVDPRWGTEADVEAVVAAAHARGMRVLVDVVLNHVHEDHALWAEHPEWFNTPYCQCGSAACPWWSHIETCWFVPYLPDIKWDHVDTLTRQVDDAIWWIERFNLDGLRVDAVPMVPRFVTRHLTAEVHRRFEAFGTRQYLVGETFVGPGERDRLRWYLGPDGLDGQFDFPLMWAIRAAFAWEQGPLWALQDEILESEAAWAGSTAIMGNFVGNHDVTRFISEAAGQIATAHPWDRRPGLPEDPVAYERLWLAQALVFTLPGAPVLYYGDEFGLPGANDPDNRRPMRFEPERSPDERRLAERVGRLGRLRRCATTLRRGAYRPLRAEAERLTFARDQGDGAPAVVVLARRPDAPTIEVGLPTEFSGATEWIDALSGARITARGEVLGPIATPPYSVAVLLPADHPCLSPLRSTD